ncbi:MAG: DUF4288 domain-containing protein [Deinococcus sp.]|nr:DUF4288 domain-containing protein [Deinococcus sp.]
MTLSGGAATEPLYFAVLHCRTTVQALNLDDWREEFHIIEATSVQEAQARAEARAAAQATEYLNAAGQTVTVWPAEVVDVQPFLFADASEAVYQRPLPKP